MKFKHATYGLSIKVDLGLALENWPNGFRDVFHRWGRPECRIHYTMWFMEFMRPGLAEIFAIRSIKRWGNPELR